MRAPLFWSRPRGIAAYALAPLEFLWTTATKRRLKNGPWAALPVPVICVGNINAGGTGKTPSVIALIGLLTEQGVKAHVVSRGYGGNSDGPLLVNEKSHTADQVGDEPLEISAFGPCWVAKDRVAGAKAAIAAGAEMILLDDGFQNPSLAKTLGIVVVDAEVGFGNGRVIPAGPLREPLITGLARADVILTIGNDAAQAKLTQIWPQIADIPRWKAQLKPLETGMDWAGNRYIAFAGIGRPGKFFTTLSNLGANVVATHAFPDHAPYSDAVLQRLQAEAQAKSAQLVTTEKDVARLPEHFKREVLALPVRLVFENTKTVQSALAVVAEQIVKEAF